MNYDDVLPPPFAWIEIPAGKMTIWEGNELENAVYSSVSRTFIQPAFAISKYPITHAQFSKFVEAGGYENQNWWTEAGWQAREEFGWTKPRAWQRSPFDTPNHPVVGVSWYEAISFCLWLSETTGDKILLPTDQQWQRAAQGDDGRAYPWGNEWDGNRCNNLVIPFYSPATTPVTQYEGQDKGDSPFGVVDMAGNVWEWCLTTSFTRHNDLHGTEVRRLRGGSWDSDDYTGDFFRTDYRTGSLPFGRTDYWGFRVCRSTDSKV